MALSTSGNHKQSVCDCPTPLCSGQAGLIVRAIAKMGRILKDDTYPRADA
jgi:hypothetical protein